MASKDYNNYFYFKSRSFWRSMNWMRPYCNVLRGSCWTAFLSRMFMSRRNCLHGPFHLEWWSFWNGLLFSIWIGVVSREPSPRVFTLQSMGQQRSDECSSYRVKVPLMSNAAWVRRGMGKISIYILINTCSCHIYCWYWRFLMCDLFHATRQWPK